MKNIIRNSILAFCLMLSGCTAPAQQNNVIQVPLGDIGLVPQTNVLITVKLLGAFPSFYNGTWINPIRTQYSDTTGTGWFTNLIPGNYAAYAQGYAGYVPFAVQTNTAGTVGISQLTCPYILPNPGTNTVSMAQLEAILAAALTINNATGTNVNLQGLFNGVDPSAPPFNLTVGNNLTVDNTVAANSILVGPYLNWNTLIAQNGDTTIGGWMLVADSTTASNFTATGSWGFSGDGSLLTDVQSTSIKGALTNQVNSVSGIMTNGNAVWLYYPTNGPMGHTLTNLPWGTVCTTSNGQPWVLSNMVWRSF